MNNNYNDLSVDFCGKTLSNPFILSSGPPTRDYSSIAQAFSKGWAGAITKSIVLNPLKDKSPHMRYLSYGDNKIALQNYEMGSELPISYWVEQTKKLKEEFPNNLLLVSLFASNNLNEWKTLAKAFSKTPIDGFELNFSCPHSDAHGRGYIIGQDYNLCGKITKTVINSFGRDKEAIIMPKLPYLVYPNERLATEICKANGANSVAAINTIAGLSSINPKNLSPRLNTKGKTASGGISYHAIKPFAFLIVNNLSKTGIPVSASGGASTDLETIISFLAYGANNLQYCTEVMLKGDGIISGLKNTLENYLSEKKLTLNELRGKASDKVVSWEEL